MKLQATAHAIVWPEHERIAFLTYGGYDYPVGTPPISVRTANLLGVPALAFVWRQSKQEDKALLDAGTIRFNANRAFSGRALHRGYQTVADR